MLKKLPEELLRLSRLETIFLSDANTVEDVSVLLKMDHSYNLILNRCKYHLFAKELGNSELLKTMTVPRTIFRKDLDNIKKYIPENKLILTDL
jgi:hypothetical protein